MNIFVLSKEPQEAARDHCDKHVVKMIVEYAQLLSTAHRLLDGRKVLVELPNGKTKPLLLLEGERYSVIPQQTGSGSFKLHGRRPYKVVIDNPTCYGFTHANHPSAAWARATTANYSWLYKLLEACLNEYTSRYGRVHGTQRVLRFLSSPPANIRSGDLTPFALAMPEEYKHEDPVEAYRRFYVGAKARFARWNHSPVPDWFKHRMERQDATNLSGAL